MISPQYLVRITDFIIGSSDFFKANKRNLENNKRRWLKSKPFVWDSTFLLLDIIWTDNLPYIFQVISVHTTFCCTK